MSHWRAMRGAVAAALGLLLTFACCSSEATQSLDRTGGLAAFSLRLPCAKASAFFGSRE